MKTVENFTTSFISLQFHVPVTSFQNATFADSYRSDVHTPTKNTFCNNGLLCLLNRTVIYRGQ